MLHGKSVREVFRKCVLSWRAKQVGRARSHLTMQRRPVDDQRRAGGPDLGGSSPGELTPAPAVVQCACHALKAHIQALVPVAQIRIEPGSMVPILALGLAVEARLAGRTMEREHAETREHSPNLGRVMTRGAVESEDERGAVPFEVARQRVRDGGRVVPGVTTMLVR